MLSKKLKSMGYTEDELEQDNPYNRKEPEMEKSELESALMQFTGTEGYTRWSPLFLKFVLTDGALFLAEKAGAYWLMDAIASHYNKYRAEEFVTVRLVQRKKDWLLTIGDGDDGILAKQVISYSDFPLTNVMLYVGTQGNLRVIMLPSEY